MRDDNFGGGLFSSPGPPECGRLISRNIRCESRLAIQDKTILLFRKEDQANPLIDDSAFFAESSGLQT
ncbi:hypothetical protein BSZ19_06335 [Bradyrhizobium japonicum]|uniref:Uncharacterized protein n=1 Tax=Bradyrhizobium japonicum TaxID=375 RepID=A0A1Y2JYI6_BRAJP|nr:hypothetical protein [Bradyrhizobium japonicum]OSJ36024.1 hypothetical protein BSZ19_06335 [Bradyrhizobium japonicum]